MKGGAKLFAYFLAVLLVGALLAPPLYWGAQALVAHGILPFLGHYSFETYFHRALLICALLFFWPLLRSLRLRSRSELGLRPNAHAGRDAGIGFLLAGIPLACAAVGLVMAKVFVLKPELPWSGMATMTAAAAAVPLLEELFFRGLLLGVLLRDLRPFTAGLVSAAFFAILHFLKAPKSTNPLVTWASGFNSIAHSFAQFCDPIMLLAGFSTLFLLGCILAHARQRTASLWLPIGLHSGWIFVSGIFGKMTFRQMLILPWLGTSLVVGLIPLALALLTWALLFWWLTSERR
ncbi:MAG: CPBP family glutamic-type intramembrane protease [Verrucomicrobiota bacterium]